MQCSYARNFMRTGYADASTPLVGQKYSISGLNKCTCVIICKWKIYGEFFRGLSFNHRWCNNYGINSAKLRNFVRYVIESSNENVRNFSHDAIRWAEYEIRLVYTSLWIRMRSFINCNISENRYHAIMLKGMFYSVSARILFLKNTQRKQKSRKKSMPNY